jgi:CubicO group peptidase (beta-lactamase class C family)
VWVNTPVNLPKSVSASVVAVALMLGAAHGAHALPDNRSSGASAWSEKVSSSAETPELTAADLEPWLDGFMRTALRVNDIAGAVVHVVKDGQVLTSEGFGVSNVETGAPVDPERTLFRVASVSKTFTWTALMQLVERGQVELDADINDYLDFAIEGYGGEPITVRDLMTHRAGFEETGKNGSLSSPSELISLESYVKQSVPARIFPPGSTTAYSNYGAALAGYLVQRVAGQSFDDYMERALFGPLGMTSSSFRQPLPTELEAQMSRGYDRASEPAQPFEYMWDAPAGSLSTTASDMGRFMIEHLTNETPGAGRLLGSETAKVMHRTIAREFTGANGMALGFYEQNRNDREVIGHGGDIIRFHTQMELYLDENVGIFVSYNSAGIGVTELRNDLMTAFADRYFPQANADQRVEQAIALKHANEVAGNYLGSRRPESSFLKAAAVINQAKLIAHADGTLTFEGFGLSIRFVEIAPYRWKQVGSDAILAVDAEGDSMRMSPTPTIVFERVAAADTSTVRGLLLASALLVLVVTVLAWPVAAIVRRRSGVIRVWKPGEKRAVIARRVASALMLAATSAWVLQFQAFLTTLTVGGALHDGALVATQVLSVACGIAAALLAIVSLVSTAQHGRDVSRVFTTLVWTSAAGYLLVQFVDLNLFRVSAFF